MGLQFNFTFIQLILQGVHLGHTIKNTVFYARWMLFATRQGLWIINLFKTVHLLKIGLYVIGSLVRSKMPIWFLNRDYTKSFILNYSSNLCGEFNSSGFWIRGLISNYKSLSRVVFRIKQKAEYLQQRHIKFRKFIYDKWFLTRNSWPRLIFVSNLKSCYLALKEASSAGVPSVGLVDTDLKSSLLTIPIPSNDESFEAVGFFNLMVANFVLINKFKQLIIWYKNIRENPRLVKLEDWLLDWIKIKKKKNVNKFKFQFNLSNLKNNIKGTRLLVVTNYRKEVKFSNSIFFSSSDKLKTKGLEVLNFLNNSTLLLNMVNQSNFCNHVLKKKTHFKKFKLKNRTFKFKTRNYDLFNVFFLGFFWGCLIRKYLFYSKIKKRLCFKFENLLSKSYFSGFLKVWGLNWNFSHESIDEDIDAFPGFNTNDINITNLKIEKPKIVKLKKQKRFKLGLWCFLKELPFEFWKKMVYLFFIDKYWVKFNKNLTQYLSFWSYFKIGVPTKRIKKKVHKNKFRLKSKIYFYKTTRVKKYISFSTLKSKIKQKQKEIELMYKPFIIKLFRWKIFLQNEVVYFKKVKLW